MCVYFLRPLAEALDYLARYPQEEKELRTRLQAHHDRPCIAHAELILLPFFFPLFEGVTAFV